MAGPANSAAGPACSSRLFALAAQSPWADAARDVVLCPVVKDFPALVVGQGVGNGAAVMAAVDSNVMLETMLANELEKVLQPGNLHHPIATEGLELVRGEFDLATIGAHLLARFH